MGCGFGSGFWTGFGPCGRGMSPGNSRSTFGALGSPNFGIGSTVVVVIVGVDYTLAVVGTLGLWVSVAQCDIAQWLGCKRPAVQVATAPHPVPDYKTVGGLAVGPAGLLVQDSNGATSAGGLSVGPAAPVFAALKCQTFF
jgi:hypothetical protein